MFVEADLQEFCVYRAFRQRRANASTTFNESSTSHEFVSLNELNEYNVDCFYLDGMLCYDGKRRYVERVPFRLLSVGGYEDLGRVSVETDIWIQTKEGQKLGVWYRLGTPGKHTLPMAADGLTSPKILARGNHD